MSADIVLIINDLKAGGSQKIVTTLARAWAERGKKVCIITLSGTERDFFVPDPPVRRVVLGVPLQGKGTRPGLLSVIKYLIPLRNALRKTGAPVAIAFLPFANILSIIASVGLGIRVVISERNDPAIQKLGFVWDLLRRLSYRFADVVTANSRGALQTLKKYVPEHKLAYVPNPVVIAPSVPAEKKHPFILAVGRLNYQKAYDLLLAAFAAVSQKYPAWRLAIAGDGNLRHDLPALAEKLGIAGRVDWLGQVTDPFPYYRAADIFALPSRFEGTPNALLEAMACGLPVIVSDASPGPLEYVDHEKSGLVVPAEDAASLALAICRLIEDEKLRKRLGGEALNALAETALEMVLMRWEQVLSG